ncbi:hypothetical protein M422DRAFT_175208, partial [Sphaerobolus stellatus SS14]
MVDTKSLQSHLVTDYVPQNTERNLLEASLGEMSKSMDVLDSKMAILQGELAQLASQKQKIADDAAICNDLISPMRKLPPEIMGEVFKECVLNDVDPDTRIPHISPKSAPLLLLHICRRWRRIALGTPRLF